MDIKEHTAMSDIKTDLDEKDLKELEELKRKLVAKYDEYPRYKIPFLSAEERIKFGKNKINDEDFDKAFDVCIKVYKNDRIEPGVPIIASTEMIAVLDEAVIGYVVGREGNNAIVVCRGSEVSGLASLLGSSIFGSNYGREEWCKFESMCKDNSDIIRMGICGYDCAENDDTPALFIHHFRPIITAREFID